MFGEANASHEDGRPHPLGGSSLASSGSTSPVDLKLSLALQDFSPTDRFGGPQQQQQQQQQQLDSHHHHAPMINGSGESAAHFGDSASSIFSQLQRRNSKARRKTATTQDLLGMGDGADIAALPMIEDETVIICAYVFGCDLEG